MIVAGISRIHRMTHRFIERELKNHQLHGISPSHGDVLFHLFRQEQLTMNQLSALIDKDKSTLTALVEKLVRMEYVQKEQDPKDGRIYRLSLTEQGRALKPVFEAISQALLNAVYANFAPEEKEQLVRLLGKIEL